MATLRALLASLLVVVAGVAGLTLATDHFRAFTTESARRLDVKAHPRPVPASPLETADGGTLRFDALRGRWVLVDFIYTRCGSYCSTLGADFATLQARLAGPIARDQVTLLSISFDPAHDGPAELAEYRSRFTARTEGWIAARPEDAAGLAALMRTFGVTAIPDGLGGFIHNAAIAVVDPSGRLVRILDWGRPDSTAHFLADRLPT